VPTNSAAVSSSIGSGILGKLSGLDAVMAGIVQTGKSTTIAKTIDAEFILLPIFLHAFSLAYSLNIINK